jgi:hypothetical protein
VKLAKRQSKPFVSHYRSLASRQYRGKYFPLLDRAQYKAR